MTEAERDKRDLNLHRVMDNYVTMFATQFGLSRQDACDHLECFLENERGERERATYISAAESFAVAYVRALEAEEAEGA